MDIFSEAVCILSFLMNFRKSFAFFFINSIFLRKIFAFLISKKFSYFLRANEMRNFRETIFSFWLQTIYLTNGNAEPTNVWRSKGWTVQTSDLQTSDWYKRQTRTNMRTNVQLVQTLDQYKRRKGTFISKNIGFGWVWKKENCIRNKLRITYCDGNQK